MRTGRTAIICFAALLLAAQLAQAQGTGKAATLPQPAKVTVVFKEYQGGKLLSNLPYILSVRTGQNLFSGSDDAHLRMGLSVPISFQGGHIEYRDVGTNIDCGVKAEGSGRYLVLVVATRSSVHHMVGALQRAPAAGGNGAQPLALASPVGDSPIFDHSSINEILLMNDGQTVQSLMATDPVTGRVLKVDITLNVVK